MDQRERKQRYDDYIERTSRAATATGRRVPYHLEYVRQHGSSCTDNGGAEERSGGDRDDQMQ